MDDPTDPRRFTEEEWRARLSPEVFRITRKNGTERAFSGALWNEKRDGVYRCACCDAPLFASETKYESGSGWPSFWDVIEPAAVGEREDRTFFMRRTEILCAQCDAHLGHVFPDGPDPSGLRYCVNSASLRFEPSTSSGEEDAGVG